MNSALRQTSGKNALHMFMLTINFTTMFSPSSLLSPSECGRAAAAAAAAASTQEADCLKAYKAWALFYLRQSPVILHQQLKHEALDSEARHSGDI